MKKFNFKLQKLLDLREAKELEVKNELAKLLAIQNKERVRQDKLREGISGNSKNLQKRLNDKIATIQESVIFERYKDVSLRAIELADVNIANMEPGIQKVREKLVIASREKKIVEKLKERKFDEYSYLLNREISNENDDMNQKIYQRSLMQDSL